MSVAVGLSPIAVMQFFDNTGKPAVGGTLLTQVGGVNYPTYSDVNGTTALPNPIPLNSRGECSTSAGSSSSVFLQQGVSYTFTLYDKDSNQLWSLGNIAANNLSIPYASTSGTNTIVATFSPALTSLFDGLTVEIKLANTTTASPTFNPNGLGAANIYYMDGTTQWLAGSGIQNMTYTLVYNSSLNSSAGGWEVQNPSPINGSYTGTATGGTASLTATITYRITANGEICTLVPGTGLAVTSNTTAFTVTGGPTIIQPLQTQSFYMSLEDATAAAAGSVTMTAGSGTITLGKGISYGGGGFTASGTKAWANGGTSSAGATVIYSLK